MLNLQTGCAVAVRFLQRLRGSSQPFLVEASDGLLYVVKFANNPQGPNIAFNESMGSYLYRACGLPVPNWSPIYVGDDFIDQNPLCWFNGTRGMERPDAGMCFGSRFLQNTERRLFEILPGTFYTRITNQTQFWLAWLVDVCARHCDNRQALFYEALDRSLDTYFIDHGHMFGGPKGKHTPQYRAASYLDLRMYPIISSLSVLELTRTVTNLDFKMLRRVADDLPAPWKTESALENFAACLETLQDARMVEVALTSILEFQRPLDLNGKEHSKFRPQPVGSLLLSEVQSRGHRNRAVF